MIELALLGAGRIGQVHANTVLQHPGARLKYVFDPVYDSAKSIVEKCGAEMASLEEILQDRKVQGILICTPSDQHATQIEEAIEAGKAIFCEKPIATDLGTTRATLEFVEFNQGILMLGFQRRFDPHFCALKSKLSEGLFGQLEQLTITSRDPEPPPYSYMKASGGLFKDMTIHDFDMARWLLDEPIQSVYATGSALVDAKTATEGHDIDTASLVLISQTGKQITILNSRRSTCGYDQRIEAHCSKGTLQVNSVRETSLVVADNTGISERPLENFFMTRYEKAYQAEISHFIDCLATFEQPLVNGLDGLEALRLAEAASMSMRTDSVIRLESI